MHVCPQAAVTVAVLYNCILVISRMAFEELRDEVKHHDNVAEKNSLLHAKLAEPGIEFVFGLDKEIKSV